MIILTNSDKRFPKGAQLPYTRYRGKPIFYDWGKKVHLHRRECARRLKQMNVCTTRT